MAMDPDHTDTTEFLGDVAVSRNGWPAVARAYRTPVSVSAVAPPAAAVNAQAPRAQIMTTAVAMRADLRAA
ncbi:hypothetical protein GOPIP_007_00060 [Gordonia polyisoprenivorans NBRC 16320 = JCM 10675]|nr:hypothetical protein GOPIP_007_00060 [Gordonia polyisoprenivorans NBRC 16320 = JCM 10675]